MKTLKTYLKARKFAIYIVMWRFLLYTFGRAIRFNNKRAKVGDKVIVRYELIKSK